MIKVVGLMAAAATGYWLFKDKARRGNRTKTFSLAAERQEDASNNSGRASTRGDAAGIFAPKPGRT